MSRTIVAMCLCSAFAIGTVGGQEPSDFGVCSTVPPAGTTLHETKVARKGDLLLLPVTIGGRDLKFVLDTGAAANALDSSVAEKVGPLKRSAKSNPEGFPDMFEMPPATIMGAKLPLVGDVACIDLSVIRVASGHDVAGIVGMPFLKQHLIQVDFDLGRVRFLKSMPDAKAGGMNLTRDEFDRPILDVELIAGKKLPMIVDTGMAVPGIGEVDRATFRQLLDDGRVQVKGPLGRAVSVSGELTGRKGKLDRFKIANFEHQDLGIREGTLNAVGLNYLSRYLVTFDFPNNRIHLEKGKRFDEPTSFDMSGMTLVRINGATRVEMVHPNGPAFELGVRAGDKIVRVSDKESDEYSLLQLRRLLAKNGQRVRLVVQRGNEIQGCELMLKDWQPVIQKRDEK